MNLRKQNLFDLYTREQWIEIFEKSIQKRGFIPRMSFWDIYLDINISNTTISVMLKNTYPEVKASKRFEYFLKNLNSSFLDFIVLGKGKGVNNTFLEKKKLFCDFVKSFGRIPTYSEYVGIQNKFKDLKLPHIVSLIKQSGCSKYGEFLRKLGFEGDFTHTNKTYNAVLDSFELKYKQEVFFEIESRKVRIDFQIFINEFEWVFVEIDGSSHYSAESAYHKNPRFWKKGVNSSVENFELKKERDLKVDSYFENKKIPLLRISHTNFLNISKIDFLNLLKIVLKGKNTSFLGKIDEKSKLVFEKLKEGKDVAQIARELNHSSPYIFYIIRKYGFGYLVPKRSEVKSLEIKQKIFEIGLKFERGENISEYSYNMRKIALERLGLISYSFPEWFDLKNPIKRKDPRFTKFCNFRYLADTEYICKLRYEYSEFKIQNGF